MSTLIEQRVSHNRQVMLSPRKQAYKLSGSLLAGDFMTPPKLCTASNDVATWTDWKEPFTCPTTGIEHFETCQGMPSNCVQDEPLRKLHLSLDRTLIPIFILDAQCTVHQSESSKRSQPSTVNSRNSSKQKYKWHTFVFAHIFFPFQLTQTEIFFDRWLNNIWGGYRSLLNKEKVLACLGKCVIVWWNQTFGP